MAHRNVRNKGLRALTAGVYFAGTVWVFGCGSRERSASPAAPTEVPTSVSAALTETQSPWAPGQNYAIGTRVTFEGVVYEARQSHTSAVGSEPPNAPALWAQPTPASITDWGPQTSYRRGSLARFNGILYESLHTHVSEVGQAPPQTPSLWRLKDPEPPKALLVVGRSRDLLRGDVVLQERLRGLGLVVEVRRANELQPQHATGKDVVVVSESSSSGDVRNKLTTAQVPVVAMDPDLFDDLKMTGNRSGRDFGFQADQRAIRIAMTGHPLAAGMSEEVVVTAAARTFKWGSPPSSAEAIKVATLANNPGRFTIFAYEAGAKMVGIRAPARRVGWFAGRDVPEVFTEDGQALFHAAVQWARNREGPTRRRPTPPAPVPDWSST